MPATFSDPRARNGPSSSVREKLAKLVAVFSAWDIPDAAAELLLGLRDRLSTVFDIDAGLDLLAAQTQVGASGRSAIATTWPSSRPTRRLSTGPKATSRCASGWKAAWSGLSGSPACSR